MKGRRIETVRDAMLERRAHDLAAIQQSLSDEARERRIARHLHARPDIGRLVRNGRAVFYTFAAGFYAEAPEPEALPAPYHGAAL